MDDRTRQMIEAYIPSPPDPTLEFEEFYYLQSTMKGEQVIKVHVLSVFPGDPFRSDDCEYSIYQVRSDGLRWVDVGYGDHFRGCHRSELYDNKEDCKNQTHSWYEQWEQLRQIQQEEKNE